jgi:hypothetical protein
VARHHQGGVLLDGIQGVQTSGIAAPGSGKEALYPKSDGHWYLRAGAGGAEIEILDAAGSWRPATSPTARRPGRRRS